MLTLRTLGSLDLYDTDGREIFPVLSQPKRFALLVYLVLAQPGKPLRRDLLLDLFWPERLDAQARNALSQSLSFLRRYLPEGMILSRGVEEVGIDLSLVHADVVEFEAAIADGRWRDALDAYGGDFLPGFHLGEASEFEDWLVRERERLRGLAAGAGWSLAQVQVQKGALMEAVRTAEAALDLVWTDETPVRCFMLALARAGDRASALSLYEKFCRRLRDELDLEPCHRTKEVAESVRNGDVPEVSEDAPIVASISSDGAVERGPNRTDSNAISRAEPPVASRGESRGHLLSRWVFSPTGVLGLLLVLFGFGAVRWSVTRDRGADLIGDLVVVPPFENRSGDPDLDELAVDAALWVEQAIQQVPGVQVVPSSFARQYASEAGRDGSPNPVHEVGHRSRAEWVVAGVIRVFGDSLELRAETIDLAHDRKEQEVVEVGPRDRPSEVLDRLARRVSGALAYEFDPYMGEMETRFQPMPAPPTLEAFREHRLGYEAYDREDFAASFQHHMAAFALDTTLVRALVAAAYMTTDFHVKDSLAEYASRHQHLLSKRGKLDLEILVTILAHDREGGLRAIRKVTQIEEGGFNSVLEGWFAMRVNLPAAALAATERYDPSLQWRRGEAHAYWLYRTEALHMLGRFEEELAEARRGRDQYPNRLDLLTAEVRALASLGRVEEAEEGIRKARALSNTAYAVALAAGRELRAHGHSKESKAVFSQAAEWVMDGRSPEELTVDERLDVATSLYGAEQWARAREMAESVVADAPENRLALGMVGSAAARLGDSVFASEVMDQLAGMAQWGGPGEHFYQMASIAAILGRSDDAMRLLFRAFSEGFPHGLRLAADMNFESLAEREDFRALVTPRG